MSSIKQTKPTLCITFVDGSIGAGKSTYINSSVDCGNLKRQCFLARRTKRARVIQVNNYLISSVKRETGWFIGLLENIDAYTKIFETHKGDSVKIQRAITAATRDSYIALIQWIKTSTLLANYPERFIFAELFIERDPRSQILFCRSYGLPEDVIDSISNSVEQLRTFLFIELSRLFAIQTVENMILLTPESDNGLSRIKERGRAFELETFKTAKDLDFIVRPYNNFVKNSHWGHIKLYEIDGKTFSYIILETEQEKQDFFFGTYYLPSQELEEESFDWESSSLSLLDEMFA